MIPHTPTGQWEAELKDAQDKVQNLDKEILATQERLATMKKLRKAAQDYAESIQEAVTNLKDKIL